jgi:acyl-CoA thioester hydrolase
MSRAPRIPANATLVQVELRWADSDSLGHVNNVAYLRLLEEARVRWIYGLNQNRAEGISGLAARHEIDYLRPLHYSNEPVRVHLWVERIGTASVTVPCVMHDPTGQPVVASKTVIVSIDPATGAPKPWEQPVREILEQHLPA